MISTSDIVILVVASSALGVGIYRWHENTQDVSAITIPASSRVISETVNNTAEPSLTSLTTLNPVNSTEPTALSSNSTVVQVLPESTPVTNITVPASEQTTGAFNLGSHRVRSGDYLGKIAQQYGTDVQTLRDLNGINGSVIQIDQEILYPL